jgi:hypothetical protein
LGVSEGRLTWLWLADYVEKTDQRTFDQASVDRYAQWRREAPQWRRFVRALSTPLRLI